MYLNENKYKNRKKRTLFFMQFGRKWHKSLTKGKCSEKGDCSLKIIKFNVIILQMLIKNSLSNLSLFIFS